MNSIEKTIGIIEKSWRTNPVLVKHNGYENPIPLRCLLNPVSNEYLAKLKSLSLPPTFKEFHSFTNGAELFKDELYGQWGLKLYNIDELDHESNYHKNQRTQDFILGDIIVGEFYGDSDLLLLRADPKSTDFGYIYVVLPLDDRKDWYLVSRSFEEFLHQFVLHQGNKFWAT